MAEASRLRIPEPDVLVLNDFTDVVKMNVTAAEFSRDLQQLLLRMKSAIMTEDESEVNFENLERSGLFNQYKQQAAHLRELDVSSLSEDEMMAFFINIHNALTVHALVDRTEQPNVVYNGHVFVKTRAYNIGGCVFSLHDIQHGILRGNTSEPGSMAKKPFEESDPRTQFTSKKLDPRVHFALVHSAKSCPRLQVYSAETLNEELDVATKDFCSQGVKASRGQSKITLARTFEWFFRDFGANDVEAIRMKSEMMTEDGSGVNFENLKRSGLFNQCKQEAAHLRELDVSTLSEDEMMAFFINIHNALTIHALVDCTEQPNVVYNGHVFVKTRAYNIGGLVFSLRDIKHGILRGNTPEPGTMGKKPFEESDPRTKFTSKKLDPRVHFALVHSAQSCPRLQVFSSETLNEELDVATKYFCSDGVKASRQKSKIRVARTFEWFYRDFGANDVEAIRWTIPYLDAEKQRRVEYLLAMLDGFGGVKLEYKDFD